jgi:hypothetical protein
MDTSANMPGHRGSEVKAGSSSIFIVVRKSECRFEALRSAPLSVAKAWDHPLGAGAPVNAIILHEPGVLIVETLGVGIPEADGRNTASNRERAIVLSEKRSAA